MQQDKSYPAGRANPAAQKMQTTPIKGGGASFRTHKLVEVSPDRVEFKAAIGAIIFYSVFFIAGIVLDIFWSHNLLSGKYRLLSPDIIVLGIVGTVFMIVGGCMLYWGTKPIVFDKRNGYFWKGRSSPENVFNIDEIKTCAKLETIKALQLLSEECHGDKGRRYNSYELNLVLDDSSRLNVVDHGNLKLIQKDTEKLSVFLGIPIMDLI